MSFPVIPSGNSRELLFTRRVQTMLGALAVQYPTLFVTVDIWRLMVTNSGNGQYIDTETEMQIRLAEGVPAFNYVKEDKLYQAEVGLIRTRVNCLILPSGYDLEPDDHVIIHGRPYIIINARETMGVCCCTIDNPKNRFMVPARNAPTNRIIGMKCNIL